MRCSNCGSENPPGKKFCGDCGAALANPCRNCGSENPLGKRFCGECGSPLNGKLQERATQPSWAESSSSDIRIARDQADISPVIKGERKTVTALFADIRVRPNLWRTSTPKRPARLSIRR
jgi:hypothetical protein